MLIKKGTVYALRGETKFVFEPKVKGVVEVRRLIPVQIAQHPGRSQFGLSVDFGACSRANVGRVAIASLTCSCPFARGSRPGHVPVFCHTD